MSIPAELWTSDDRRKSTRRGWTFDPIGPFTLWQQGRAHYREGFTLAWLDPELTGHTWNDDLAEFIAEEAAKGEPLYERAWLFYCFLELNGMLVRTSHGEIVRREFNYQPKQ
jgi:hypothetical protein